VTMRLPLRPDEDYGGDELHWRTGGQSTIEGPLGRFERCIAVIGVGNLMNSPVYWTCPDVGVARWEDRGCGPMYGSAGFGELTDYHIPDIVLVP